MCIELFLLRLFNFYKTLMHAAKFAFILYVFFGINANKYLFIVNKFA